MITRLRAVLATLVVATVASACLPTPPSDLREDDCVNLSGDGTEASVARVDCAEPHDAQVFFVASLDDAPAEYSSAAVTAVAEEECLFMFWDFVGEHYYQSELEARWLVPGESA